MIAATSSRERACEGGSTECERTFPWLKNWQIGQFCSSQSDAEPPCKFARGFSAPRTSGGHAPCRCMSWQRPGSRWSPCPNSETAPKRPANSQTTMDGSLRGMREITRYANNPGKGGRLSIHLNRNGRKMQDGRSFSVLSTNRNVPCLTPLETSHYFSSVCCPRNFRPEFPLVAPGSAIPRRWPRSTTYKYGMKISTGGGSRDADSDATTNG